MGLNVLVMMTLGGMWWLGLICFVLLSFLLTGCCIQVCVSGLLVVGRITFRIKRTIKAKARGVLKKRKEKKSMKQKKREKQKGEEDERCTEAGWGGL